MNIETGKTWEKIYSEGMQINRYPYDAVVTFIYRNYPRNIKRKNVKILEVGCGSGNNLWFAAREGFNVTGIDVSESAINYARNRFEDENLIGNFVVGNLEELPFDNDTFDFVIDRAALSYINFNTCKQVILDINRVLKVDGKMFFNPFSDRHSSCVSGKYNPNGITTDIKEGIKDCGDTCFYGKRDIYELFKKSWRIESIQHTETVEQINPEYFVYADWKVIAQKIGDNND
jgi:ubiquinone/menaquinone biosynthesis C-methylase UbiE